MSEIKNGGLDQYGAEPVEQQQFGTAGVEEVNRFSTDPTNLANNAFYSGYERFLHLWRLIL